MTLRYRIIKLNTDLYKAEYFEGIWIFGKWRGMGQIFLSLESAEKYVIEYAHMVIASHDKIVREITVK